MDSTRKLVLAVDDDSSLVAILEGALAQLGFDCVVATSADEAAKMLDDIKPAVVLCDFELPGTLSAADLFALVNERTAARFMVMTGHRGMNVLNSLPPDTRILRKPFGLATLKEALSEEVPSPASDF